MQPPYMESSSHHPEYTLVVPACPPSTTDTSLLMARHKKPDGLPTVQVTPTKRKAILIYKDQLGMSFAQIANEAPEFRDTSCRDTTISRNYHDAKKNGTYRDTSKYKARGRPRKIPEAELLAGITDLDTGRAADGADLQAQRFPDVPQRTVRHQLRTHGLLGYVRRRKPALDARKVALRLDFARKWAEWIDPSRWMAECVIWSDESKFILRGSDGLRWCRRRRGHAVLAPRNVSQRVRRGLGSGKVTVWGCITKDGVGRLHRINGRMDRWMYIDILEVCVY